MKIKYSYSLLFGFTLLLLLTNACKKDKNTAVESFLTNGAWELANLQQFTYLGSVLQKTDTINRKCVINQTITFNNDRSCTYTGNFQCNSQSAKGNWNMLKKDTIRLQSDLSLKDSTNQLTQPFRDSRVVNLGQYSLVIETGDIGAIFTSRQVRKIFRYSFVHE
ncbi:MAG: hypothetical protein ACOH2A_08025 [Sphingobacteriaceae bacterium]